MKKFILISYLPLVEQILENSKSELAFDYIEYMILFFCLAIAMIMMMLIPAVLFFFNDWQFNIKPRLQENIGQRN